MARSPSKLAAIAARATLPAGRLLKREFRTGHVAGSYGPDDVKTDIDERAERLVLDELADRVPTHATHGEETGLRGESDHVWVIDPLDGTNNFAAGFPSFATATCCLQDGDPVAAAVYEPLPGSLYVVARDETARVLEGDTLDAIVSSGDDRRDLDLDGDDPAGRELTADSDTPLEHGTVSFVVGLPAIRDPDGVERAKRMTDALEPICKRVLRSWSPCVDWGLLARGGTEAIVCYRPDPYEQYPGTLLAETAGAAVRESADIYVAAATTSVADRLFEVVTDT